MTVVPLLQVNLTLTVAAADELLTLDAATLEATELDTADDELLATELLVAAEELAMAELDDTAELAAVELLATTPQLAGKFIVLLVI